MAKTGAGKTGNQGPNPKRKREQHVSYVGNGVMVETVSRPGGLCYAVYNGSTTIDIAPSFCAGPLYITPPEDKHGLVKKRVVMLPTDVGVSLSYSELMKRMVNFIHSYVDAPAFWERLGAHYALMTWFHDRFTAVPYLRFLGETDSGKTRFLMAVGALCYRGIMAGGAITVSPIFRLLDMYRGTFLIDEADFKDSNAWSEIIKVLNCGYTDTIPVLRSESNGTSFDVRAFQTYGPKILSTRKRFQDDALESRCLTYETASDRNIRDDIQRQLPQEFNVEAQELRNVLLRFRFENYQTIRIDESELLDLEPRTTQIAASLLACCRDRQFHSDLKAFLKGQARRAKTDSPKVYLVLALDQFKGKRVQVAKLAEEASKLAEQDGAARDSLGCKLVGQMLANWGFEKRPSKGKKFVTPDATRVEELAKVYIV